MRLVHVIRSDGFAGVERHVSLLAAAQVEQGDDVVVIGGDHERMAAVFAGTAVRHLTGNTLAQVASSLRRVIAGADVVHAHMTAAELAAVLVRWPRLRPPLVVTRHFAAARGASPAGRIAARFIAGRVQAQIAISAYVATSIDGPARVVYPGVESQPETSIPREPWVLLVQRLEPEKRADVGVAAFAASGLAERGWRLVIAGDGSQRSMLEQQAHQAGVASAVEFLGARRDVPELMARSRVFLAPCPIEGLGLSVLEAMAAGLPVVASASGGHLETLPAMAREFCFPPNDAVAAGERLARLASDEGLRAELAAAGRARQRLRFTPRAQAVATADVYRNVVGGESGRAPGPDARHAAAARKVSAAPAHAARPRVVVLDHTAQTGGAEIALSRLLGALPRESFDLRVVLFEDGPLADALRARDLSVDVLDLDATTAHRGRHDLLRHPGALAASALATARFSRRLAATLRGEESDLVVANSLKSAIIAVIAAPQARVGWVWHLHDRLADDYLPRPLVSAMRVLARVGPRHVVANSRATAELIRLRPERLHVAYPGLPADHFASQPPAPAVPTFGMLGRLGPTKGQREFVTAAASVLRDHPAARFVVVGEALFDDDRGYADEVRRLPDSLGIADRVEFTGWVDDPSRRLASFTAVVHASPVPEPFGQVVVEAMARGVPVIATAGGGVTEIMWPDDSTPDERPDVVAGEALLTPLGQLVAAGDAVGLARAMSWIVDHPDDARARARRAQGQARRRFSIENTAEVVAAAWLAGLRSR